MPVLKLKEGQVAVVVLDGFLLEMVASHGIKDKCVFVVAGLCVFVELVLVIGEPAFKTPGSLAVRASIQVHLQNTQVKSELDFLGAVGSCDESGVDL